MTIHRQITNKAVSAIVSVGTPYTNTIARVFYYSNIKINFAIGMGAQDMIVHFSTIYPITRHELLLIRSLLVKSQDPSTVSSRLWGRSAQAIAHATYLLPEWRSILFGKDAMLLYRFEDALPENWWIAEEAKMPHHAIYKEMAHRRSESLKVLAALTQLKTN